MTPVPPATEAAKTSRSQAHHPARRSLPPLSFVGSGGVEGSSFSIAEETHRPHGFGNHEGGREDDARSPDGEGSWADYIIVMEPKFSEKFLSKFKEKIWILDVGPDIWKNPLDPRLQKAEANNSLLYVNAAIIGPQHNAAIA